MSEAPTAQSVTVGGNRFVAGLLWQTLTRVRSLMNEAREIGRRDRMDVVAIRTGKVLQAGFAKLSASSVGAYSLAAALAGILGDDWIGVFEVDAVTQTYAIAGAKGGAIIPGCDAIGPRAQIEEQLRSDYNMHRFGRVICPASFGFGGEERTLADVLGSGKLRSEYKLTALASGARNRKLVFAGLGAALLVGAGVGGWLYWDHQQDLAEQAQAEAAAAAAAAQAQAAQTKSGGTAAASAALPHPWASQPKAGAVLTACDGAIGHTPLALGGWVVDSANCNGTALQLVYKRQGNATILSARAAITAAGYQVDGVDDAGDTANASLNLPALNAGGDDALASMQAAGDAIKSLLQSRAIAFSFTPKPPPEPPKPLPGASAPPPPPLPDWKTSTFTVTSRYTPATVMQGVAGLPGLRLTTIAARRTQAAIEWTLTGEINGK